MTRHHDGFIVVLAVQPRRKQYSKLASSSELSQSSTDGLNSLMSTNLTFSLRPRTRKISTISSTVSPEETTSRHPLNRSIASTVRLTCTGPSASSSTEAKTAPACVQVLPVCVKLCPLSQWQGRLRKRWAGQLGGKCCSWAAKSVRELGKRAARRESAFSEESLQDSNYFPRCGFPEIRMCCEPAPYLLWKAQALPQRLSLEPPITKGTPPFSSKPSSSAVISSMHSSAALELLAASLKRIFPQSVTFSFSMEMPCSGFTTGPTRPKNLLRQHGPRSSPLLLMHRLRAQQKGTPTTTTSPSLPSLMMLPIRRSSGFIIMIRLLWCNAEPPSPPF